MSKLILNPRSSTEKIMQVGGTARGRAKGGRRWPKVLGSAARGSTRSWGS